MKNNFPVVILHEGNYELEDQIRNVFGGNDKFVEVNNDTSCFEPLFSLNELEIANQNDIIDYKTSPDNFSKMVIYSQHTNPGVIVIY